MRPGTRRNESSGVLSGGPGAGGAAAPGTVVGSGSPCSPTLPDANRHSPNSASAGSTISAVNTTSGFVEVDRPLMNQRPPGAAGDGHRGRGDRAR